MSRTIYETREEAQAECDAFLASWSYVYFPRAYVVETSDGKFYAVCERASSCD
jgi:hypothetical protein